MAPTGSGKTVMAAAFAEMCAAAGEPMLFIAADRIVLSEQTIRSFERFNVGRVGLLQAENTRDLDAPIVVACGPSLRSPRRRLELARRRFKHVWIDECHIHDKAVSDFVDEVLAGGGHVVGLTATPFAGHLSAYHRLVQCSTTTQLQATGRLVPAETVRCWDPAEEMEAVKTDSAGEWQAGATGEAMSPFVTRVAEGWRDELTARGLPLTTPTIVFAASVAHAERLHGAFQAVGATSEVLSYKHEGSEHTLARFADGATTLLVSIAKISIGFDSPHAAVAVLARPLAVSLALLMQQIGRVLRTSAGKTSALVLDYGGNLGRFGKALSQVWNQGVECLPRPRPPKRKAGWKCFSCFAINPRGRQICGECGAVKPLGNGAPPERLCAVCGTGFAPSVTACPQCGQPVEPGAGLVCPVHGLALATFADDSRGCPFPGCKVSARDVELLENPAAARALVAPEPEPQRTIWLQASAIARRVGPEKAQRWYRAIVKDMTGDWPSKAHMPDPSIKALGIPDMTVVRRIKALEDAWRRGLRNA